MRSATTPLLVVVLLGPETVSVSPKAVAITRRRVEVLLTTPSSVLLGPQTVSVSRKAAAITRRVETLLTTLLRITLLEQKIVSYA